MDFSTTLRIWAREERMAEMLSDRSLSEEESLPTVV
ncbi:MAG: hypothetical protein G01um101416_951 [Microgenomates group bacterium Gr01-1014_16]|nr:MAG: hypothetical protein G01um101416_951 [Microgenomates group bacterium Gr01-1014_16]